MTGGPRVDAHGKNAANENVTDGLGLSGGSLPARVRVCAPKWADPPHAEGPTSRVSEKYHRALWKHGAWRPQSAPVQRKIGDDAEEDHMAWNRPCSSAVRRENSKSVYKARGLQEKAERTAARKAARKAAMAAKDDPTGASEGPSKVSRKVPPRPGTATRRPSSAMLEMPSNESRQRPSSAPAIDRKTTGVPSVAVPRAFEELKNDKGHSVAQGSEEGLGFFYCCQFYALGGGEGGICGPIDGPQCPSCTRLQRRLHKNDELATIVEDRMTGSFVCGRFIRELPYGGGAVYCGVKGKVCESCLRFMAYQSAAYQGQVCMCGEPFERGMATDFSMMTRCRRCGRQRTEKLSANELGPNVVDFYHKTQYGRPLRETYPRWHPVVHPNQEYTVHLTSKSGAKCLQNYVQPLIEGQVDRSTSSTASLEKAQPLGNEADIERIMGDCPTLFPRHSPQVPEPGLANPGEVNAASSWTPGRFLHWIAATRGKRVTWPLKHGFPTKESMAKRCEQFDEAGTTWQNG